MPAILGATLEFAPHQECLSLNPSARPAPSDSCILSAAILMALLMDVVLKASHSESICGLKGAAGCGMGICLIIPPVAQPVPQKTLGKYQRRCTNTHLETGDSSSSYSDRTPSPESPMPLNSGKKLKADHGSFYHARSILQIRGIGLPQGRQTKPHRARQDPDIPCPSPWSHEATSQEDDERKPLNFSQPRSL